MPLSLSLLVILSMAMAEYIIFSMVKYFGTENYLCICEDFEIIIMRNEFS